MRPFTFAIKSICAVYGININKSIRSAFEVFRAVERLQKSMVQLIL